MTPVMQRTTTIITTMRNLANLLLRDYDTIAWLSTWPKKERERRMAKRALAIAAFKVSPGGKREPPDLAHICFCVWFGNVSVVWLAKTHEFRKKNAQVLIGNSSHNFQLADRRRPFSFGVSVRLSRRRSGNGVSGSSMGCANWGSKPWSRWKSKDLRLTGSSRAFNLAMAL